jgi:hypothetical protein
VRAYTRAHTLVSADANDVTLANKRRQYSTTTSTHISRIPIRARRPRRS